MMTLILVLFLQISPVGRLLFTVQDSGINKGVFFAPGFEKDTVSWFFVNYGGKFIISKKFFIDMRILFKHGNDSTYPFYNWHNIGEMDYRRALLGYRNKNIMFSWGLDSPSLSRGSFTRLFFDGFEPEFPQIQILLSGTRFHFFYIAGQMEEMKSNPFKSTGATKYFAYHRVGFKWKNIELKLAEGVLFKSYEGTHPDWYLFSPVALWYPRQANSNRTDLNIGWIFEGDLNVSPDAVLYGELFVDDAPYKREADENPRVGILTGFDKNNSKWRFISEIALVTRYTYSYYPKRLELSWFYNSYPLGTTTGTDFIKLSLFLMKKSKISAFGYFETLLQGEGRAGEPFEVGNLSKKVLLSGDVRKTLRMETGIQTRLHKIDALFRVGILTGGSSQFIMGATISYLMSNWTKN